MSALSDMLDASQRKAIATLGKAYIARAEQPDDELFIGLLHQIGEDDDRKIGFLISAWKIQRELNGEAPGEAQPKAAPETWRSEPASDSQWKRLRDDCRKANVQLPQGPLNKGQASDIIEQLAAGTYEPVPF